MKKRRELLQFGALSLLAPAIRAASVSLASAFSGCHASQSHVQPATHATGLYPLSLVAFNQVRLEDHFWLPRLETQRKTLIPFALEKTEPAVENLRRTAQFNRGEKVQLLSLAHYVSSDLYKVMEGAAYLLAIKPHPALEEHMDAIVDTIAAAQAPDGYLYEMHQAPVAADHPNRRLNMIGDRRYGFVVHSHELYCMGHMYEAAIAYFLVTGKDKWLKVAEKNAEHINRVFFVGDPSYNDGKAINQADGHQEIELALAKLYRVTGKPLYLEMANRFLDIRGITYVPKESDAPASWPAQFRRDVMMPTYAQQHAPVVEQREAVGHAVRAAYMYSAMADVGELKRTDIYNPALNAIWHDIVDKKMHITGGLGAVHGIEGFGPAHELPNKDTYNETCAAVSNVLFNFRMFLLTQDAQFLDVAEVALFNNALAGTNMEGNRFFYVNPLETDGKTTFNHGSPGRSPWFTTACCPSNLARLIPQVSGLMYAHDRNEIYVTLYGSNSTSIELQSGTISIQQTSHYPFDGEISLRLNPAKVQSFRLKLRIPTWARSDQFIPGKLYNYLNEVRVDCTVRVNGTAVKPRIERGFAVIDRAWSPGDEVRLSLPMPVRFNTAIEEVKADQGRICVTRGPLVYCAEGADNPSMEDLSIDPQIAATFIRTSVFPSGVLTGIVKIELSQVPAKLGNAPVILIPYYAWNNRGDNAMIVWLRNRKSRYQS